MHSSTLQTTFLLSVSKKKLAQSAKTKHTCHSTNSPPRIEHPPTVPPLLPQCVFYLLYQDPIITWLVYPLHEHADLFSLQTDPRSVAGLTRNIEIPRRHDTLYSINSNLTLRDKLWESIDINTGIVALDQEFIEEHKLPPSMVFPWDPSKNVYSTTAHHHLHCLVRLSASSSVLCKLLT